MLADPQRGPRLVMKAGRIVRDRLPRGLTEKGPRCGPLGSCRGAKRFRIHPGSPR